MAGKINYYRGYRIVHAQTKGYFVCTFNYRSINYHMPRKFYWQMDAGLDELNRYIDLLTLRRKIDADKIEAAGYAYDHEYDEQPKDEVVINVSPEMLISVLLGELPLEVPIHTHLVLRGDKRGGKFTPSRIPLELANTGLLDAYYNGLREWAETGRPICLREQLDGVTDRKGNSKPADGYFPCASLIEAERQGKGEVMSLGAGHNRAPAPPQPVEQTVDSRRLGDCTESLCLLTPPEGHAYFIRRLFTDQGVCIYTATSWHAEGPWTVHTATPEAQALMEAA